MQRVQGQGSESENAQRTAQAKFTSKSREAAQANGIDDSPAMIAQRKKLNSLFGGAIQRQGPEEKMLQGKFNGVQRVEEEEPLQGKFETAQRLEEEEPLQGKFEAVQRVEEEEPLQGKFETAQRVEEEEPLQGKFEAASSTQLKEEVAKPNASTQLSTGDTGLPDNLKSGIENLSGMSMDNVKVHYNSSHPAQLNALAYAQGTDIHVAPGQEQHLPHEAWHVVQQAQGRVKPTMQMKEGVPVNDDKGLEHEADVMGAKAQQAGQMQSAVTQPTHVAFASTQGSSIQRYVYGSGRVTRTVTVTGNNDTNQFEECTYNSVEFAKDDLLPDTGTGTQTAAWAGWLTNRDKDRNATQLHVVNKLWGGLGGPREGNIVPGSPAENTHHLHDAENIFKGCFNSSNKAKNKCKYECWATPQYGTSVNVKNGNVDCDDPRISVKITDNVASKTYDVTYGTGLTFRDGS